MFHYGHLRALKLADEGSDLHIVGLISDKAARAWVGSIVSSETERRRVLENLKCVDWVMPQDTLDPTENLKKLHHIYSDAEITLFRGDGISIVAAREYLKGIGGKVQSIDYYEKLSPAQIMDTLNNYQANAERHQGIIATKAEVLAALKERLTLSKIEEIYILKIKDFKADPEKIFADISAKYTNRRGGQRIVVRSSSSHEDSLETSNAGHYESVLNVDPASYEEVINAIERVRKSYDTQPQDEDDEQILIQSQTQDVALSGVIFTREIQASKPYYVINYDASGSTNTVTSGGRSSVVYIAHDADINEIPDRWKNLYLAVKEIESILSRLLLDIEFAIRTNGEIVIFQVRPLAANYRYGVSGLSNKLLDDKNKIRSQYQLFRKNSGNNILSDMAFWNPAEIIGENPHRLDYSLYKEIITSHSWNSGLVPLGYREVNRDLMYRLGNKPFICIEYAFESLIPARISDSLAQKLKSFYIAKLKRDFSAHDKIEFEIVINCFDFAIDDKLAELRANNFTDEETNALKQALFDITNEAVRNYERILHDDLASLDDLEKIRLNVERQLSDLTGTHELVKHDGEFLSSGTTGNHKLVKSNGEFLETGKTEIHELIKLAGELLDAVKNLGTPQFSRQARLAFIARALCGSLRDKNFWSVEDYNNFMAGIETVATSFKEDFSKFINGEINTEDFNGTYGHLRAGTYDITTPRYDAQDFSEGNGNISASDGKNQSRETFTNIDGTERALKVYGIDAEPEEFLRFMKQALEQREYFKFIFTRSLSRAIEIIAIIAEKLGFDRNNISYFGIEEILGLQFYDNINDMSEYLRETLPERKKIYSGYSQVIMPEIISSPSDFDIVSMTDARPNFITDKKISSECIKLGENNNLDIAGKIILIEKADPGYDWIFTKNIAGLITKYGGAASHMAIRCAEFGIPAAIGCGEKIFASACSREFIELDCHNRKIL